jgi:hypothetical protein
VTLFAYGSRTDGKGHSQGSSHLYANGQARSNLTLKRDFNDRYMKDWPTMNVSLPFALSMITLLIVICVGVVLLMKNRNSQAKRGETPGGVAGPADDSSINR